MPPHRIRFNQDQYARLRRGSELMDFTEWNRWYAEYLADNLFLRSTDIYGAHLAGADLAYWYLEGADLRFAQLQGADLSYSYLKHANLANANLAGTNLWRAFLAGAELSGANPDAAVYDPADRIKFDPDHASRLREAAESGNIEAWNEWYKTELSKADGDVRLYGAYLEEASLRNLDLSGAVLCYAHLEGADLRHVNLSGANLSHVHLEGADLWQADLTGADLRHAELGGANLAGAKKEKALF
ncbi:MAG: pentapeptide repeat-containing protein [Methanocorpusculum sp.]|nr:pentapeptide repeat-containing protein [Methanocorpusculum sp.]